MPFLSSELITAVRALAGRLPGPRRLGLVLLLTTALSAVGAQAAAAYQNPFAGDQFYIGRTDMGVDVCLTPGEPIRAVGNGFVVGIDRDWFEGQPYIWYELTSGPSAGRYVYVAEQINHLAHVGQVLHAGQVVARYARQGTCIETGWSAADGATWAQVTTGYHEGEVTPAGESFARFLISVGVPGQFELTGPAPHAARAKPKRRKHRTLRKPAPHRPPVIITGTVPLGG